ncbi:enoyl-CoA hydratase-related protein [Candidatus Amarolinea aalborgensis]|jgi:2-(1,2-epoxy-1,2-dihydrophenyl)acetyl-CoA isomerase|uniref:enoyl-CoA hydratase-related protein n=1 Tax=Candidatus Amarolinea aalborgensis TaxID=2249329 RepID=UPI003BF966EA
MVETIHYQVTGAVATIVLNRPEKLNAFNEQMTRETMAAFAQADQDDGVRVIVLTGAGRGFSAGQDLEDLQRRPADLSIGDHLRRGYNALVLSMRTIEKPVITAINGVAAGAGMSIALAGDFRLASDKASFIQAFIKIGLIPDSGSTWLLPRLIGPTRALELMSTGDRLSAHDALAWGLINRVIPAEEFEATVAAWAQRLAEAPTRALGLTKRAFNQALTSTLAEALEVEAVLQDVAGATADSREGVQAFLEKRAPVFTGR